MSRGEVRCGLKAGRQQLNDRIELQLSFVLSRMFEVERECLRKRRQCNKKSGAVMLTVVIMSSLL